MKKLIFCFTTILLVLSLSPAEGFAMMHGTGHHMGRYGGYCKGPRWGWYGARRQVNTEKEVRELVSEFLTDTDLTIGDIEDKEIYFEAEIKDEDGQVVDLLIVDKRTCRIRSAY